MKKASNPMPITCSIYENNILTKCQHLDGDLLCTLAGKIDCIHQVKIQKPPPPPTPPEKR